jgi:hypothetical protein
LVASGWFVPREKYCWLVGDKPNKHGDSMPKFSTAISDDVARNMNPRFTTFKINTRNIKN